MASPRELADKAFALLQDALRDSESRAHELDTELKRKRPAKNQLEQQLDVLAHRLEKVEAESERWRREAGHLEELVDNERVKVAQLKKRLQIAESGPDKLTKREINFWRAKAEKFDAETQEYKTRIAFLRNELKVRDETIGRLESESDAPDGHSAAPAAEAGPGRETGRQLERELAQRVSRVASLEQELAAVRESAAAQPVPGVELQALHDRIRVLETALADAQSGGASLQSALQAREQTLASIEAELEQANRALADRQHSDEQSEAAHGRLKETLSERDNRIASLAAELEKVRSATAKDSGELTELRQALAGARQQVSALEAERQNFDAALSQTRSDAEKARGALQEAENRCNALRRQLEDKTAEIARLLARQAELSEAKSRTNEQLAGLESELRDEKVRSENLSELANERRDQLTKLEERVEEIEERYEEARWRLGKAQHHERLARKRRKLVGAVIGVVRARHKSNTALKAGLDSLRTFKATAEDNQHKLLARIDKLQSQLKEAEETIQRHQGATMTQQEASESRARVVELEERLNTQVELIQSLEEELKAAKAFRREQDSQAEQIEMLRRDLERKDGVIAQLEADAKEQQRKLAKLRGSESESMRLKALSEQDRSAIDALEREVSQLREALATRAAGGEGTDASTEALEQKLQEKDESIARLLGTVKENEARIAELGEAANTWKRKYQFLSTEASDAYKTAAEK